MSRGEKAHQVTVDLSCLSKPSRKLHASYSFATVMLWALEPS
jgi:hypothetical protein